MSENKTAADAPAMAQAALEEVAAIRKGQFGTMDDVALGSAEAALSDIAALPAAPLPPEVVALVRKAREWRGHPKYPLTGIETNLAAIPLPGDKATP